MTNKRKIILVFLGLFALWVFATVNFLSTQEYSLKNLEGRHGDTTFTFSNSGEMMKGDIATGEFRSGFPNLGIVAVRFYTFYRSNSDILRFRIKEVGQKDWYYLADYKTDQFQHNKLFPFGFPVVNASQNKKYIFEIESLNGATGSGVFVNPIFPAMVDHHVFSKKEVLSSLSSLFMFIIYKTKNLIEDDLFRYNTLNFMLPLAAYATFLEIGVFLIPSFILVITFTLWQIFSLSDFHYFSILTIMFYWTLVSIKHKVSPNVSVIISICSLVLGMILILFNLRIASENTATWSFLYLAIFSILISLETWGVLKPKVTISGLGKQLSLFTRNFSISVRNLLTNGTDGSKSFFNYINLNKLATVRLYKLLSKNRTTRFILNILACLLLYTVTYKTILKFQNLKIAYQNYYNSEFLVAYITRVITPAIFITAFVLLLSYCVYRSSRQIFLTLITLSLTLAIFIPRSLGRTSAMLVIPRILNISPSTTSEVWTDVVVSGKNFRNKPFIGKILIDGIEQGVYVVDWTDERVIFRTSPEITKSGMVQLVPLERGASNKVPFIYNYHK